MVVSHVFETLCCFFDDNIDYSKKKLYLCIVNSQLCLNQ